MFKAIFASALLVFSMSSFARPNHGNGHDRPHDRPNGGAVVAGAVIGGIVAHELADDKGHKGKKYRRIKRECEREFNRPRRVQRCIDNRM